MKALLIGGGIGGLTTAIALEKAGIDTSVYEAAPEIRAVGAGIWMATNAMQVFDRLGLASDVVAAGLPLERICISDNRLRIIQNTEMQMIRDQFGYSITSIARSRLQEVLLKNYGKTINLAKHCTRFEQNGYGVTAYFNDGSSAQGDILIGADGIHSAVRQQMYPDARLRYSGQTCWRGIASIQLDAPLDKACLEAWGKTARLGFSVLSSSEVYWFAVQKAPRGEKDPPTGIKQKLQERYAGFNQPIPDIIAATPEEKIIRNDIIDLNPIKKWHHGRVCLIGDAAHAMTPNMGQGGGQAVEDAWVLSQILKDAKTPEKAFAIFESKRRKKVNQVVSTSWLIGKMAHISFGQGLRNALLRLVPIDFS